MSKINRNDPCPCGSGKKYKQCCINKADATAGTRLTIAAAPQTFAQQYQMAVQYFQRGRWAEAEVVAKSAAKLSPKNADIHHLLGAIYQGSHQWPAAQEAMLRALKLEPRNEKFLFTAADIAAQVGSVDQAVTHYQAALRIKPAFVEAWFNLGNVCRGAGRLDEAVKAYQGALAVKPDFVEAWSNLGDVLRQLSRYDEASRTYRQALSLRPQSGMIHSKLGLALQRLGHLREAIESFQQAVDLNPEDAQAASNLLLASQYDPDLTREALLERHLAFARRFEVPRQARQFGHTPAPLRGRRLKVGYVSPDLRKHSVGSFAEPVITRHDQARFEVHAYYSNTHEDEVTARFKSAVEHWHDCASLSDDALAHRIHADGIDVLVDLSGHTAGNRLLTFALKPAPVQVTWLGYPGTTGLASMDYRLTDGYLDPVGVSEGDYSETLVRLPTYSHFNPPLVSPEVGLLPCLSRGGITFACLNNTTKINDRVVAVWAQVLQAVPGSRLVIGNVNESAMADWLTSAFASHGVGVDRLVFKPRLSLSDYLTLHQEIDVGLDPFPWNGGATTMYSLWMGVPVLTFIGDHPAGRLGWSSLQYAGCPEFAAASLADYVPLVRDWASRPQDLALVRQGLRARMVRAAQAPDVNVVEALEQAYVDMWARRTQGSIG